MAEDRVQAICDQLDVLTEQAARRMRECSPDLSTAMGGSEISFMTQEELAHRHELMLQLPSTGELVAQARTRILARIAERRQRRRQDEIQQVDPDVAHVEGVVRETAAMRWPQEGEEDPTQAWAGECGVFADAVWREARKSGVEVEVVGLMGRFSDLPFEVTPPPGLSLQELTDFGVERALDHAWIRFRGRHYDASCPSGVAQVFDLRCLRQCAVEILRVEHPDVLSRLCVDSPWWHESAALLDEFLQHRTMVQSRERTSVWAREGRSCA